MFVIHIYSLGGLNAGITYITSTNRMLGRIV